MPDKATIKKADAAKLTVQREDTAFLSNEGDVISFLCNGRLIRFRGPYSLVCFDHIKHWDNGYIEVMTKYSHSEDLIEEYIDLIPILENLYIDPSEFLQNIKKVEVKYVGTGNN